jgi:hypothetical protein
MNEGPVSVRATTYDELAHAGRAYAIWQEMSEDERNSVRYGVFPSDRMTRSEAKGFDRRELCAALMKIAQGRASRRSSGPER